MVNIVDTYKKLCDKSVKNNTLSTDSIDQEGTHIAQDKIYRKFINDMVNGNIKTIKAAKEIAVLLKKDVVKYDKHRWYA
jgi:hypothetical protein